MLHPIGTEGSFEGEQNIGGLKQPHLEEDLLMEDTPASKATSRFWQFNIGNVTILATLLIGILSLWTTGVREFDNHESRLIASERSDALLSPLPGRVVVLETRIDILQAQLNQLTMSTNRTSDAIIGMREDIAAIKASLAARGN